MKWCIQYNIISIYIFNHNVIDILYTYWCFTKHDIIRVSSWCTRKQISPRSFSINQQVIIMLISWNLECGNQINWYKSQIAEIDYSLTSLSHKLHNIFYINKIM